MAAFHILYANPFVPGDAIHAYLQPMPGIAIIKSSTGTAGLHIICSLPYHEVSISDAIRAYLKLAPEAANEPDLIDTASPVSASL